MSNKPSIVFLFDVDNTLLDNDAVRENLREHLAKHYGTAARDRESRAGGSDVDVFCHGDHPHEHTWTDILRLNAS